MKRTSILIAAIAAILVPRTAHAQQTLSVIVRDETRRALQNVEVSVPSLGRVGTTDSTGRVRFAGLQPGTFYLRARRVGYEPVNIQVTLETEDLEMSVALRVRPISLDTIRVVEKCPWRGYSGFGCRQNIGRGLFLDRSSIDSSGVDDLAKLFYDRPGFQVIRANRTGIPYVKSTFKGGRCLVVLVNGLPANSTTNQPPRYAREVIAVEAYADPRQVPKDYEKFSWAGRIPCGLVNYWTSTR